MPSPLHPLVVRAREALARGDFRSAETAAEERLKTAGRDTNALAVRCAAQQRRGQFGEAARTLQTVIGIDARADWAHNDLIQLLHTHGRREDAMQVARTALSANPDNAQANNHFGLLLSEANDLPAGEWHFQRALELAGPQPSYLTNLALNLTRQRRFEEADARFAQAHQLAPQDAATLAHWSKLFEMTGDLGRAEELLNRAQTHSSAEDVSLQRAGLLATSGQHEAALAVIDAAALSSGEARLLRGRLHEQLGHYEGAWRDFVEGKRKLATEGGGLQYKADAVEALFGRLKQFFTRANMALLPRAPTRADTAQPVFILGLPRSGAAVIEQFLSRHSAVRAGGELAFAGELHKLAGHMFPGAAFPDNLAQSWTTDNRYAAALLRDCYLARAQACGLSDGGNRFFTDRSPFVEMYLPLLKMAFPQAKFVHLVRHPLDVCVSMMANAVPAGFNCGYRIEDIAHHLAAVSDLVEHYRRELDSSHFVLKFETLMSDPNGETARLLEFLGLPTRSEVRLELKDCPVGRHRHYLQPLKPYFARLEGALAAHGYTAT